MTLKREGESERDREGEPPVEAGGTRVKRKTTHGGHQERERGYISAGTPTGTDVDATWDY